MNLIDQVSDLTDRVTTIQEGENSRRQFAALQLRAQKLAQPAAAYASIARRARTLTDRGIAFEVPQDLGSLGFRAKQVLEAFERDPGTAIEPSDEARFAFWDRLGEVAVSTERALREGWAAHVSATMPRIDSGLIELLPSVKSSDRKRAVEIQEAVRAISVTAPESVDVVKRLDALAAEAAQLMNSIGVAGMSDDVRIFVSALAGNAATLEHVTPTVLEWLSAEGLVARVRLRLSDQG